MRPTLTRRSRAAFLISGLCLAVLPATALQAQDAKKGEAQQPTGKVQAGNNSTSISKAGQSPVVNKTPLGKDKEGANSGQDQPDPNSKARVSWEFGTDNKAFGKVMQGDVLNHKFELKSSGEEDLVIKQAKPTCGCTVARVVCQQADGTMGPYTFGNPIPPGRMIEIQATLHTQNKRGHASSRINMFTNDPRGQVSLGLEAEVDPFFQVNPAVINFNEVSSKDQLTDKATISTTRGERIKLSAVTDATPPGVKVELKPLDADAEGKATRYELTAVVGPGCAEGQLAYAVPIRSDLLIPGAEKLPNGQMPSYETTVTVMARVAGLISYTPQFISLGLLKPGQVKATSIRISSHDASFKLGELACEIQGRDTPAWEFAKCFQVFTRPVANENAVDIEVRLNGLPETLNGSFAGTLLVKVNHPDKPELKLPITGVCRSAGGAGPEVQQPVPIPAPAPAGQGGVKQPPK